MRYKHLGTIIAIVFFGTITVGLLAYTPAFASPPFTLVQMETDAQDIVYPPVEGRPGSPPCAGNMERAVALVDRVLGRAIDPTIRAIIINFTRCGAVSTIYLGTGERLGVVNSYKAAFGRLPSTTAHWFDVIKIANGRFPGETSAQAETAAKARFKQIYRRDPNLAQQNDTTAVNIMAYGLRPLPRNLNSETTALRSFKAIFGRGPSSATDWDAVRAITYSGARREAVPAPPLAYAPTPTPAPTSTPPVPAPPPFPTPPQPAAPLPTPTPPPAALPTLRVTQASTSLQSTYFIGDTQIPAFALNFEAEGSAVTLTKLQLRFFFDKDGDFTFAGRYQGDSDPKFIESASLYQGDHRIAGPVAPNGYQFSFDNLTSTIPAGTRSTLTVKINLRRAMEERTIYIAPSVMPWNDIIATDRQERRVAISSPEETINYGAHPRTLIQVTKRASSISYPVYRGELSCGGTRCASNEICVRNRCEQAPLTLAFINGGFEDNEYFDLAIDTFITTLEGATPLKECPGQVRVHKLYTCCTDEENIEQCAARYVPQFDNAIFLHPLNQSSCRAVSEHGDKGIIAIACDRAFLHEWGHSFAGFADQYCLGATHNGRTLNPVSDAQGCGYSPTKRTYTCPVGGVCWNRTTREDDRKGGGIVCNSHAQCEAEHGPGWECVSCFTPAQNSWEWNYCSRFQDQPVFCLGNPTPGGSRSVMGSGHLIELEFDAQEYAILREKLVCK